MPSHREKRVLPYTPEQIFDVVAEIERYPEFIPWCTKATIYRRTPTTLAKGGEGEVVLADLMVKFKMFKETFTSEVTLDPDNREILIRYIDGPFKYLRNEWRFLPAEGRGRNGEMGCTVDFYIDFEFRNRALRMLISALFDEAIHRMVGAFEARAHDLYGRQPVRRPRASQPVAVAGE